MAFKHAIVVEAGGEVVICKQEHGGFAGGQKAAVGVADESAEFGMAASRFWLRVTIRLKDVFNGF
ncbi:hypothetical protein [cf. Phormidesmis sp. LEGE 11477]|uniref:hypothetical protein n=1 Tax=cf. Phormidesmis sp. LEGE 11477 TaxID=1828680 RepID=UPI0018814948|nr:hypothetical protein [cf. Phormidesmis sp. LEGE 11477]MBE9062402.1 hypothetical protein [cf. Phormidesmis sp. LEGE 11477]